MNFEYTQEERNALQEFARFCRENVSEVSARLDTLSRDEASAVVCAHLRSLAKAGYPGLTLPREAGGSGLTFVQAVPYHRVLGASCPSTFVTVEASAGTVGGILTQFGTTEQKAHLSALGTGRSIGALAVTEPGAGSDLFSMETTAYHDSEGVLSGRKTMVANGPLAHLVLVMAVTDSSAGQRGFSLFLVPADTHGLSRGGAMDLVGLPGAAFGDVTLDGCRLPESAILGGPGDGLAIHQWSMCRGAVAYAALSVGILGECLEWSLRHAMERKVGGKPLIRNQEVSFKLADMQTLMDASLQLATHAAWLLDRADGEASVQASCAKVFASEAAVRGAHDAQQILGSRALVKGHVVERLARDARVLELGKSTSEMHRVAIASRELSRQGYEPNARVFHQARVARRTVMPRKLEGRVAICAVAQTPYVRENITQRFQGMALDVLESLLKQTGLDFSENTGIGHAISVSDDVFDARTISDNAMSDVLGAHFRSEEKVAQEGLQALYYGVATVLSGHADVVLVLGHCKESQSASRNRVTHLAFDPFYTRPVGLDFCAAAALQAQAYLGRSAVTEQQLARLVVRARRLAAGNPLTSTLLPVTEQEVLASALLADPIRQLHAYPVSDGAVGMILASEERAREITDTPVWITGVGNCFDSFFLGDRDLASNFALRQAASRAYQRAGIRDPKGAFDVVELSDQYAYQLPMWAEGLGLCGDGQGAAWLESEGPDRDRVNRSGGMLAGNPLILAGLVRASEAALQLSGKAEDRQVPGARTAVAHGVMGPAGQFHSVVTLATDEGARHEK